jgi:hypothetical protein
VKASTRAYKYPISWKTSTRVLLKPHSIAKVLKRRDSSTSERDVMCVVIGGEVEEDGEFNEFEDEYREAREERGWYGIPEGGTST